MPQPQAARYPGRDDTHDFFAERRAALETWTALLLEIERGERGLESAKIANSGQPIVMAGQLPMNPHGPKTVTAVERLAARVESLCWRLGR